MNAIKRLLSLAENEGNGGTYVYKKVLEEIPYLVCSPDHGRRAATDMVVAEICIAIGTYRVGKLNQPLPNIVILYDKVLSRKAREYCRMALEKTCRNAENHLAYHKQQSDAFQEAVDKGLIIEKTEGGVPIDRNGGKTGGPQTELPAATSSHPHANHAQLTAPGQSQGFPGTDPHGMEYSDVMQRTSELHIRRRPVTPTPANDSYAQPGYPQKALPQGQGMNGARYPYTR